MDVIKFLRKHELAVPFTKKERIDIEELFRPLLHVKISNLTAKLLKVAILDGPNHNKRNLLLVKKFFSKLKKEGLITKNIIRYIPLPPDDCTTTCTNDDLYQILKYFQKCKFVAQRNHKGDKRTIIIRDTIIALALTAGLGQSHQDILNIKIKDIDMDECTIMLHGQEFSFDLIAEFLHPMLMELFEEATQNPDKEAFLVYNFHYLNGQKQKSFLLFSKIRVALQKLSIYNCASIKDLRKLYVYNMIHLPIHQLEEIMGRDSDRFLQKDAAYINAKYEYIELQKRNKTMGMRMPVKTLELPCC